MLLEAKLNIPSDISIIGYDNMAYSNLTHPRLSTVHHDMYEIGKSVVDILIHRLESGTYNSMKQIIDPKIVPRDSVRKL
jgi:DNA-binding LacI/PurR family transcriptional regulator